VQAAEDAHSDALCVPEHASQNDAHRVSPNAGSEAFAIGWIVHRVLTAASVAVRHFGDAFPGLSGGILGQCAGSAHRRPRLTCVTEHRCA
jgi:hypothetical protein